MANRTEHMEYGGLTGAITYLLAMKAQNQPADLGGLLASAVGGAIAGALPDEIEPANNGNHRKRAHSLTTAAGIVNQSKQTWDNPQLESKQKAFWIAMGAAYLSHLAVDSETPAGIPII